MAQSTHSPGTPAGGTATEIRSQNLPAVPYADLPEPLPMRHVIGPSVLLLAGAIGSGEYVLWPYITSQVGMSLVWLVMIGVATQYFLNMEIERYTLATGETAVSGFTRLWKPWGWLFIIMTVVPWAWPGWATGGTTTLSFVFGFSEDAIPYVTIGVLLLIGAVLTVSPVVYQTVEKVQFFFVALIVLFLVYAAVALLGFDGYEALGKGFLEVDQIPDDAETVGAATLLGAIAFAGAGGALNLVQSNWVRDKGLGMGARLPKVVSPFTGEETAAPTTGFFFRRDEENLRRWRGWWKVANREQFWTFFAIGAAALLILMTLTYVSVGTGGDAESFDFIQAEGEALKTEHGDWLGTMFWLIGTVVLFSTNLAVLDMVGRVTADVLKTGPLAANTKWSESRLYFTVVWLEIAFGSAILLSGVDQPLLLLVIASSLNGLVMFVYSALLIQLNRGMLPREIGLGGGRLAAIWWAVLFYGFFSVILLWDQIGNLFE
jgi:Mn2+/Fe2+ NRAMP family transporter